MQPSYDPHIAADAPFPVQALVIARCELGGRELPPDTHVWIHGIDGNKLDAEHKGRMGRIPRTAVIAAPVPTPSLQQLRQLDPCFGLPLDQFAEVVKSDAHYYRILSCTQHGSWFLEDTRGGVGMYNRLIFLGVERPEDHERTWRKYHDLSDDMLNYMGIAS